MGVEGLPNHQRNKCFILIDNIIIKRQRTLYFKEDFTILYIFFIFFPFIVFIHFLYIILISFMIHKYF